MSLLDLDAAPRLKRRPASRPAPAPHAVVLKFGSSILRGPQDVPGVVSEIYRHVRQGRRVVAVVSAFHGQTDRLLGEARGLGHDHENDHLPRYVALGEETAASLVAIGCDRVGLSCQALSVRELGIVAHGPAEEASPIRLDGDHLARALASHEAVIVPGYGAVDEDGRVVLLGRGGSDMSAIFLAAGLGLASVRLLKDVDGVYEGDPSAGKAASRFEALDWATARRVAGKLVQDRAIDFAEAQGLAIEVAAMGRDCKSVIGHAGRPAASAPRPARRKVVVAGCGVVGGGVLERLLAEPERFEVAGVLVRDLDRHAVAAAKAPFTDDAVAFRALDLDLFIDAGCGIEPSASLIEHFLARGVSVASANKQAVAARLPQLEAARTGEAELLYSAAVGGSVPLLETAARCRGEGAVLLEGLLNSTSNFVLGRIGEGSSLADAIIDARQAGFAEADASDDLEGRDAVAKLRLLAQAVWGEDVQDFTTIEVLDREPAVGEGQVLKQVARCRKGADGRLSAEVRLEALPADQYLARARAEENRLRIVLSGGREVRASGKGAGRWPTTEAVMADVLDLTRRHAARPPLKASA